MDISTTGMLIRCEASLAVGIPPRVGIPMDQDTMRAAVEVRRLVPGVGVGVEFKHLALRARTLLRLLILRLATPSSG